MDYVDARAEPPQDARPQIRMVLTRLHAQGYVFGDLREPNILFDSDGQVKFVDFDWCGRYDRDSAEVGNGTYAYYPLAMSRTPGMWAADSMKPLTQIRPEHDYGMLDLLWR
jgi:serine/threonine protein kinase